MLSACNHTPRMQIVADLSNTTARSKYPGHDDNELHCIVHMFWTVLA